jgi:hypothetical protein
VSMDPTGMHWVSYGLPRRQLATLGHAYRSRPLLGPIGQV